MSTLRAGLIISFEIADAGTSASEPQFTPQELLALMLFHARKAQTPGMHEDEPFSTNISNQLVVETQRAILAIIDHLEKTKRELLMAALPKGGTAPDLDGDLDDDMPF